MMQAKLLNTRRDLGALLLYLTARHGLPADYQELRVVHDPAQDVENRADARVFCYTTPDEWTIHCAEALDWLLPHYRIGILLHEIGHIYLHAFGQRKGSADLAEVEVDAWIRLAVPEARYSYAQTEYTDREGRESTAYGLQRVDDDFVRLVTGMARWVNSTKPTTMKN